MEYNLEMVSFPVITVCVYWIMNLLKYMFGEKELFKRLIPLLSCILGAGLGVVAFYIVPTVAPASHVVIALFMGAASGLTATGFNQIIKQINKK